MRTALFALAIFLSTASVPVGTLEERSQVDEFMVVRGSGYEGVVVQASSPSHQLYKMGVPPGTLASSPWTPSSEDIAALESALAIFLAGEGPIIVDSRILERPQVRQTINALKRQYFGIHIGNSRHVIVHGVPERLARDRWRSEVILMTDGGCENSWFDFDVDAQRVLWLLCGGTA